MTQIPDQLTESQAPGFLTDEQAHYWAMGWDAHQDELRDQLSDAHQRIFDLTRALEAAQDQADEYREVLEDLVTDECEKRAIGGGPGWRERHEKSWARAMELFEP